MMNKSSPLFYRPAQTGTPDNKLANPIPSAIKLVVPIKLTNTTTNAVAVRELTRNLSSINFLPRSKIGDIAIANANLAGRMTLSITVKPAYNARNAGFCPGDIGDKPVYYLCYEQPR